MTALLFVDIESTDLSPATLTMLEIAWTITDLDGSQRGPLRSRYTEITDDDPPVTPRRRVGGGFEWSGTNNSSVALRMAQESGLFDGWLACPASQRIGHAAELERLILDDIATVCDLGERNPDGSTPRWFREPERIHLCGSGVAQFDQPVLRRFLPQVVPGFGRSGATHYRPVDVSGNQTGLLGSSMDHEVIQRAINIYGQDIIEIEYADPPLCAYRGPVDFGPDKPHRAAADVARAVVVQRALWRFAAPLREALGVAR